jgi:hypothetical protein
MVERGCGGGVSLSGSNVKGPLRIGIMGHHTLKTHCRELEGTLLYWGLWVMKGRLWGWAFLFMGAQLGNLEWSCLLSTLRDG